MNRSRAAHDLASSTAATREVDFMAICEPNKALVKGDGWLKDRRSDVAVFFLNKKTEVKGTFAGEGYIRIKFRFGNVFCCYSSPNIPLLQYRREIDGLMEDCRNTNGEVIVLGDINAKSPLWGSPITDARGEYLVEWLSALDMVVINEGNRPTFERRGASSFIDITSATRGTAAKISNWEVLEEESLSDHKYIFFEIKTAGHTHKARERKKWLGDWDVFRELIGWRAEASVEEERTPENCVRWLKEAYQTSLIRTEGQAPRKMPYWWSAEIQVQRNACTYSRRTAGRVCRRGDASDEEREEAREAYKTSKRELRRLINASKRKHWKELCAELENDIWGDAYKIATGRLTSRAPVDIDADRRREITEALFTVGGDPGNPQTGGAENGAIEPFTLQELEEAIAGIKKGKAPGIDGIPPEAIIEAARAQPMLLLDMLNGMLRRQEFPDRWKTAKLVLILKGGKSMESPSSYRPICLIDTLAKLYEGMLRNRLEKALEEAGGLSANQHGFRKGHSTIQAVTEVKMAAERTTSKWFVLVALDVKNAFNTASWGGILTQLRSKNIPHYLGKVIGSYLQNRRVEVSKGEEVAVTAGVPQGSVLGPTLWNVLYDPVLDLDLTEGARSMAFADDLALMVEAQDAEELMYRVNESTRRVGVWMQYNGLDLAPHKTEAVIIKGPRDRRRVTFTLDDTEIIPKRSIKYLGIWIDDKGSWGDHIKATCKKAEQRMAALTRLMPNLGGPSSGKRRVLSSVVQSILLYGAPVWSAAMRVKSYKTRMEKVQRQALLRVASAYRTVSTNAVQVVTATAPIHLLAEERRYVHERGGGHLPAVRTEARERTLDMWQAEWDQCRMVAQWTKRLIPDIRPWVTCQHRTTDYFMTQVLTGHGSFGTYTKRIGKTEHHRCRYCDDEDTPEHTLFQCGRWERDRREAGTSLGVELDAGNITQEMMRSMRRWNIIHGFVRKIMKIKEEEERREQGMN